MKRSLFLFALPLISFSCTPSSKAESSSPQGAPEIQVVTDSNGAMTVDFTSVDTLLGVPSPADTPTPPPLTERDCVNAHTSYVAALAKKSADAKGWAYVAAYCDLEPGMSREKALAVFEGAYHLGTQDWAKQGSYDEWWRWKWHEPGNKNPRFMRSAALEVEFRNESLKKIGLSFTTPQFSKEAAKGSL